LWGSWDQPINLLLTRQSAKRCISRNDKLSGPEAAAISGAHLWIANASSSITELNASNGSLVRVIGYWANDIMSPVAIMASGSHVWMADKWTNSVAEFSASNGSRVRVIDAPADKLHEPDAIVASGSHVWIADCGTSNPCPGGNGSVTELNSSNGSLIRDDFDGPHNRCERF
jgi:DNA-binding beta-propeller fold protein YncE